MIYIYGPMTGVVRWNFPAFFAEELRLIDAGYVDIYNPARVDMEVDHFDPDNPHPRPMKHYARRDLDGLFACAQMSALPGWDESKGAKAEHAVGTWLGIDQSGALPPSAEYLRRADEVIANIRKSWASGHTHSLADAKPSILDEAKAAVRGPRGEDYGHPRDDFTRTGRIWGAVLGIPDITPEKVALCMMGVKQSRLCQTPGHRDSVVDIAGYAECYDMCSGDK